MKGARFCFLEQHAVATQLVWTLVHAQHVQPGGTGSRGVKSRQVVNKATPTPSNIHPATYARLESEDSANNKTRRHDVPQTAKATTYTMQSCCGISTPP